MAVAAAEALNLGTWATRAAYAADVLGTADYLKQKLKSIKMPKATKRSRTTKRGRKRPYRSKRTRRSKSRNWRKSRLAKIGHQVGSGNAKRCVTTNLAISENIRTIYTVDLTSIEKGSNLNQRRRDMVNIRGFKLSHQYKNKSPNPVIINYAIVMDKRQMDGVTAVTDEDFFRGNFTQRAQNFVLSLSGTVMNSLSLNPERFVILMRKRMMLGPGFVTDPEATTQTGYSYDVTKSYRYFNHYVPIRRQFRFEDDKCQTPLVLIYWYDFFMAPPDQTQTTNVVDHQIYGVTYFKEPKV
jgi:hypothetical protein